MYEDIDEEYFDETYMEEISNGIYQLQHMRFQVVLN